MKLFSKNGHNVEKRSVQISVADPAFLDFFGLTRSITGVRINEFTALKLSAVWQGANIVAGTIAGLPLRTLETLKDGSKERVGSFLDNPAGPDSLTAYEWKELLVAQMILHGEGFGLHLHNEAGAIIGLELIHPSQVSVEKVNILDGKLFNVSFNNGKQETFTSRELTHFMGFTTDGIRGLGLIQIARDSLGISISGEVAAGRLFATGALIAGILTPDNEDISEDDAKEIKESIRAKMLGAEHAGDIAVVNRSLKFQPWMMSSEDAQFLESRAFQIEEVARYLGVPPHLLMQTEKQTSWGTGIEEQNNAFSKFTLFRWTNRIQERLSRLVRSPKFVEFDFTGLEQPVASSEINLLINQVNAGLITVNEARRIRNMPSIEGGDDLKGITASTGLQPEQEMEENE